MRIDAREPQRENAEGRISEILEYDSNSTVERDLQASKHLSEILSIDDGRQIDDSDEHASNAASAIHDSLKQDSNVTVESDRH
jgi:hypothetical protein